jgi:hypothetical protein
MVDAVTSEYLFSGSRRKLLHLTNVSDGTGESGVVKIDVSAITFGFPPLAAQYVAIDMIEYDIQGMDSVRLYFDADTDDEAAILPAGAGVMDFAAYGGKVDPKTTGYTGDVKLTTSGAVSGGTYDLRIHFRPKRV